MKRTILILTLLTCLGCRALLYTDAERDAAYLGKDAAQNLLVEKPSDLRRQTVNAALDASVYRVGRADPIPRSPEWKSPEVAEVKAVERKMEAAKVDAQRDPVEKGIETIVKVVEKVRTETEGIPWIPGIAAGASAVLGTLGLAYRKIRKARKDMDNVARVVEKSVSGTALIALKEKFKAAAIPELNAAVQRIQGR